MTSATSTALRFAFAGMIAMAVAMGIGRFVYTPILPGMMEELHLSAADAGWIASANYLGYLAGAFAAAGGWAHGRERLLMLAGLGASALLAALMGLSDTIAAFLVIRFLAGLASAFVMVFLASIVFSHLAAAGRSDLQAWHFGGVGLGIAVSSVLMAALVSEHAGWAAGWLWSAAISACGFIVVALLVDSGPLASGDTGREPALPKDRSLTKVIVAYGLFGFGYVVTATFLVAIVRQGGGGRVFEAVVWMVTGLAGFPRSGSGRRYRHGSAFTRPMRWDVSSKSSALSQASRQAGAPGRCSAACSLAARSLPSPRSACRPRGNWRHKLPGGPSP